MRYFIFSFISLLSLWWWQQDVFKQIINPHYVAAVDASSLNPQQIEDTFADSLSKAAVALTSKSVTYDPAYFAMKYPMGDVPEGKGVCTDVVIRAYRKLDIDLQQLVHEDMKAHFEEYPKIWGLKNTDTNIDHRRVPNLQTFFRRMGAEKKISMESKEYLPGDIVAWNLGGATTHIGVVSNRKVPGTDRYYIVHNIGFGQELSDCLYSYKIIGHYAYRGPKEAWP